MKFDFYLSEMAVSDLHGGGLTLQRVLGDDLLQIEQFVHLGRFTDIYPVTEKLKNRSVQVSSRWDTDLARKLIGRTAARAMRKKTFAIKNTGIRAARLLNSSFKKGQCLTGLVCPQAAESLYAMEALKRYRPVRYISWVMDDHLVQYIDGQWQYPSQTEDLFGKHLQGAEHVFVISPVMQQFYFDRFGVRSTVLFGPDGTPAANSYNITTTDAIKIGYFGAVAPWQIDALALVAGMLNNTGTQLHIYSGIDQLPVQIDKPGVSLIGRIGPAEVLHTMQQYDALLLPMSFMEQKRHMSEFNIATKMSEYLASGVPILALGPPYAAMIKYLKQSNAAIIIESGDEAAIRKGLAALHQPETINKILANAQMLIANETGTAIMQKRWSRCVNEYLS